MDSALHITFAQDRPLWLALAVIAGILLAMALFYRRVSGRVSRKYLFLLMGLRAAAVLAVLLCLFKPAIAYLRGSIDRSTLIVMADVSQSMSVRDFPGQPNRFERVRDLFRKPGGAMGRIAKKFDMHWYAFDSNARRLKSRNDIALLSADGSATDIHAGVKDALGSSTANEIGGVLLFTDGINTGPMNVPAALARLGPPFYAIGVGSNLREQENYRDIMIERVEARREVPVKTGSPIEVFVEAVGYPDRVAEVVLKEDGIEVAREKVVLDNAVGTQKVQLQYAPQNKGDFELTLSIPPDASERIVENNEARVPVFVHDPKIRLLYIEGHVRNEYRELRRVLQLDPNIEALCLLRVAQGRFMMQGNIPDVELAGLPKTYEDMNPFKVIILGSIDKDFFAGSQLEDMRRFVEEGGGLMMIGGKSSFGPGGYGGTPIEEVLPVICGGRNAGQELDKFPLTLTASGRAHPIFAGLSEFFIQSASGASMQLPALLGCVRVEEAKPAAEVLAVNPRRKSRNRPLVAVAAGRYGNGRSVAATIDSTHLWYRPMRGMKKESPYVRYWGQTVRWLAGTDEPQQAAGPGVVAYPDKHFYEPGATARLHALVTDAEGQATGRAKVNATLKRDGEDEEATVQLPLMTGTRNEHEALLEALKPGKYEVVVSARLDGRELGEAAFTFRVGEPTREFERVDLNEKMLRDVASATEGLYLPLLSIDQLPDVLQARSEQKIERKEIRLWNSPMLFIAFILLLTAEWILRKRRLLR